MEHPSQCLSSTPRLNHGRCQVLEKAATRVDQVKPEKEWYIAQDGFFFH